MNKRKIILMLFFLLNCSYKSDKDWNTPIHDVIKMSTKVIIRSGWYPNIDTNEIKILLELTGSNEIQELIENIRINSNKSGDECLCFGGPNFDFYKNDTIVASLSLHHGIAFRWEKGCWPGDGALTRESADWIVNFLESKNIPEPKKERDHGQKLKDAYFDKHPLKKLRLEWSSKKFFKELHKTQKFNCD